MGKVINPGDEIYTKIAGVTHRNEEGRSIQRILKDLADYDPDSLNLTLEREPDNPYDENAIKVYCEGEHIGYIKAELAKKLADLVDDGVVSGSVSEITGGTEGHLYGCNICLTVAEEPASRRYVTVKRPKSQERDTQDWFDADGKLSVWLDAKALSAVSTSALTAYHEILSSTARAELAKSKDPQYQADLDYMDKLSDELQLVGSECKSRTERIRASAKPSLPENRKPTFKESCAQQKWLLLVLGIFIAAFGILLAAAEYKMGFVMIALAVFSIICFVVGIFASN